VKRLTATGDASRTEIQAAFTAAAAGGHVDLLDHLLTRCAVDITGDENAALVAAAANGRLEAVRFLHDRGANLNARDGEALSFAAAGEHGHVVRYLHAHGAQHSLLTVEGAARIGEMLEEIRSADPLYHPSRIWEFLSDINNTMLGWGGEDNFKRTVNQNYFNFIPTSLLDRKILNLVGLWVRSPHWKIFGYRIEDPDNDPRRWCSWDERYYVFKENHEFRLRLYKWYVAFLYEYGLQADCHGILTRLEEPETGNPIRIWRDGKLVSQDLVSSVLERNVILDALVIRKEGAAQIVAELGAGYGRLAWVILATSPCRYFIFDIPPALYISEWYLSRLFPQKRVFRFRRFRSYQEIAAELERADIAFFTANQLEMLPDRCVDAFVTISSLHEMRREHIRHFIELMTAKARDVIYLKQHRDYVNPWDGLRIKRSEYTLPPAWRLAIDRSDVVNPGFFELLAKRQQE